MEKTAQMLYSQEISSRFNHTVGWRDEVLLNAGVTEQAPLPYKACSWPSCSLVHDNTNLPLHSPLCLPRHVHTCILLVPAMVWEVCKPKAVISAVQLRCLAECGDLRKFLQWPRETLSSLAPLASWTSHDHTDLPSYSQLLPTLQHI